MPASGRSKAEPSAAIPQPPSQYAPVLSQYATLQPITTPCQMLAPRSVPQQLQHAPMIAGCGGPMGQIQSHGQRPAATQPPCALQAQQLSLQGELHSERHVHQSMPQAMAAVGGSRPIVGATATSPFNTGYALPYCAYGAPTTPVGHVGHPMAQIAQQVHIQVVPGPGQMFQQPHILPFGQPVQVAPPMHIVAGQLFATPQTPAPTNQPAQGQPR